MKCSVCGQDHSNQVNDFPKGAKVIAKGGDSVGKVFDDGPGIPIMEGSLGIVVGHTVNGRAMIVFSSYESIHTFHYPDDYLSLAREEEIKHHSTAPPHHS